MGECEAPVNWNWSFVRHILPMLLDGVGVTVRVAVLAYVAALALGLSFAILRRCGNALVQGSISWLTEGLRRTPLLVQLYVLFYVLPSLGVTLSADTAGVIGLGLNYAGYLSEVLRAGISGVPRTQWEAALACNLSPAQTWRYVILPQALPPMVPPLANYLIAIFKETPILAMIGVMELMNHARVEANLSYRYLEPMILVGIFFVLVSIPAMALTGALEARHGREAASTGPQR